MTEITMSAPAEFDRPVLYGVEVEVDCASISVGRRGDIVAEVLSLWGLGPFTVDGSSVEMAASMSASPLRYDPCKPWLRGTL